MRHIKLTALSLFLISLMSCNEKRDAKIKSKQFDRLSSESLYKREFLMIDFDSVNAEKIEIYISKDKDTFFNQYMTYKNSVLDTTNSEFYTLKTSKTKRKHIYKGTITLYTKHKNLKLDEKNRRTINFGYCVQYKDSIDIIFKDTKLKNTIEFEYENFYNDKLQGIIYQIVERDTLVNDKEMVVLSQTKLLVDNHSKTDNLFAESHDIVSDNNYSLENKNLVKDE